MENIAGLLHVEADPLREADPGRDLDPTITRNENRACRDLGGRDVNRVGKWHPCVGPQFGGTDQDFPRDWNHCKSSAVGKELLERCGCRLIVFDHRLDEAFRERKFACHREHFAAFKASQKSDLSVLDR
ncbi:MAG TPA: hypothetical protein VGN97_20650 [Mesorhizobium sp.]|nr:hypothetical protein [Mesorhizobium sp.]